MADIDRVISGNPIIPPVPQDRAVGEREKKQRRDENKKSPADDRNDNKGDNGDGGIDYYA